jgi:hypothetical protein
VISVSFRAVEDIPKALLHAGDRAGLIEAMTSLKDALDEAIPPAVNNKKKPM